MGMGLRGWLQGMGLGNGERGEERWCGGAV